MKHIEAKVKENNNVKASERDYVITEMCCRLCGEMLNYGLCINHPKCEDCPIQIVVDHMRKKERG